MESIRAPIHIRNYNIFNFNIYDRELHLPRTHREEAMKNTLALVALLLAGCAPVLGETITISTSAWYKSEPRFVFWCSTCTAPCAELSRTTESIKSNGWSELKLGNSTDTLKWTIYCGENKFEIVVIKNKMFLNNNWREVKP